MRKILIYSMLATFLCAGCVINPGIQGSGNVTKQQRSITAFEKIEIASGPFTVHLSQGDIERVEVEIDDNLQQYVDVRNEGNKLVLDVLNKVKFGKTSKNNIYVTLKNIDLLSVSGVSKVKTTNPLNGGSLALNASGVFDGELEVVCEKLDAVLSGVGNLELRGRATELNVRQSGVGSLNAKMLIAGKVDVSNSGVGSVSIHATEELSMSNSGVGSINYSGDAIIKTIQTSGVGKINKTE